MKRILLTTTSLILAAGFAHAEVTFSGKGELGFNRTAKVNAVARGAGTAHGSYTMSSADGAQVLTLVAVANKVTPSTTALVDAADTAAKLVLLLAAPTDAAKKDSYREAQRVEALNAANRAHNLGTVAVKAGDFVAYSGYDLNVAVSGAADNGMTYSMGFDMGAGQIADRDDDRAMDNMGTTIAASALTIGYNGVTYVVGQNEIDDLYDDSQNGDLSVAGSMGGISYTLVTDFEKDTAAVTGSTTFTGSATSGADTFAVVAAKAAVHESTSLKLSGAAGALGWSLTSTNKNDSGDAASAVNLSYAAGDALTFALNHDTKGKAAAITKLTATYVMDALTLSLSTANDKSHAGNTNTNSKASQNLSLAYAAGPMKATFATDESSAWSVVTQYDLGGGAQAFATVDHTEFAVLGLSFAF